MPRRQKPPGFEKWTWDEIRAGRRMPKGEKRGRRLAKSLGATEDQHGRIQPPTGEGSGTYYLVMAVLAVITFGAVIVAPKGCAHEDKVRAHRKVALPN